MLQYNSNDQKLPAIDEDEVFRVILREIHQIKWANQEGVPLGSRLYQISISR
jgi:hypothetical protein